eukprot:CAMPEP_0117446878 /NCGR_PEP_ID=MMETSP0759-20121206/6576_1 /TAXON_ID=63605 /ORGANISM="Percolomonas cosmopolitus, Strain WS" /LENGTH=206 /DNA_ID=CAMNT_0005239175 /DNA_START=63 /DNA_END=683 /DNA_ORIENTATION=-
MVKSLKTQRRLAADILKCGKGRVWIAPDALSDVKMANSREAIRKLIKEENIVKRQVVMRSRYRWRFVQKQKKMGRHSGTGMFRGTKEARNPAKEAWMARQRVLRRLLNKFRSAGKIDSHLYRTLYAKAKGNTFKNKRVLLEHIFKMKQEAERARKLEEQKKALIEKHRRDREKRAARETRRAQRIRKEADEAAKLLRVAMEKAGKA